MTTSEHIAKGLEAARLQEENRALRRRILDLEYIDFSHQRDVAALELILDAPRRTSRRKHAEAQVVAIRQLVERQHIRRGGCAS